MNETFLVLKKIKNYGYSDQKQITRKINDLYVKVGRTEDGPSILNNDKTILADYSQYRYAPH